MLASQIAEAERLAEEEASESEWRAPTSRETVSPTAKMAARFA